MKSCHFAVTWMELKGVMLSEISQSEKDKYHIISLVCMKFKKQTKGGKGKKEREVIQGTDSEL